MSFLQPRTFTCGNRVPRRAVSCRNRTLRTSLSRLRLDGRTPRIKRVAHEELPVRRTAGILLPLRCAGCRARNGECSAARAARFRGGHALSDAARIAGHQRRARPMVPSRCGTRVYPFITPIASILPTPILFLPDAFIGLCTSIYLARQPLPRISRRRDDASADHVCRRRKHHVSRSHPSHTTRSIRRHRALRPRRLLPATLRRRRSRDSISSKYHDERSLPLHSTHRAPQCAADTRRTIPDDRKRTRHGARCDAPDCRRFAHAAACRTHGAQRCKCGRLGWFGCQCRRLESFSAFPTQLTTACCCWPRSYSCVDNETIGMSGVSQNDKSEVFSLGGYVVGCPQSVSLYSSNQLK